MNVQGETALSQVKWKANITGGSQKQVASVDKARLKEYLQESSNQSENSKAPVLTGQSFSSDASQAKTPQVRTYTVKEGENLTDIAQKFSVSEDTLIVANDLSGPKDITSGDELHILPTNGVVKNLTSEEEIQKLAEKYDVKAETIRSYNNLDEEQIAKKTEVIIPEADIPYSELPHKEAPQVRTASQQTPYTQPAAVSANRGRNIDGYFALPAPGRIKPHYNYAGVDIINSPGTNIRASAPGKVIAAGFHGGGYGNYVKIQHPNNTVTLYSHMRSLTVKNGDHVNRGQTVGRMGSTGLTIPADASHLHYEVHGAQNPLK